MTAPSDAIERMARAMARQEFGRDTEEAFWTNPCTGSNLYRSYANAALKAMRVPTEAMVEAGAKSAWQTGSDWDSPDTWDAVPEYAKDYWRDKFRCAHIGAIDAALEGR